MVSSASGGGAGRSAGGRSGRASSFCSQVRHSGDAGEGGSPEFRARHSAASAPLTRGEVSRTSSRKVENRNASTSRRTRSEEHTSELQSRFDLVCRLLLEKKKK